MEGTEHLIQVSSLFCFFHRGNAFLLIFFKFKASTSPQHSFLGPQHPVCHTTTNDQQFQSKNFKRWFVIFLFCKQNHFFQIRKQIAGTSLNLQELFCSSDSQFNSNFSSRNKKSLSMKTSAVNTLFGQSSHKSQQRLNDLSKKLLVYTLTYDLANLSFIKMVSSFSKFQ